MIKKILDWFVFSSKDPARISLTLKAGLPAGLPAVILIFGFLGVKNGDVELGAAIDGIVLVATGVGSVVTGGYAIYGAVRKVYLTFKKQ